MVVDASSPPRATVVIVEDHAVVGETLAVALRGRGHRVMVSDPSDEDPLAIASAVEADVALLDLDLGHDRSGLDLVTPLVDGGVRVVILTGVTDRARLAACIAAGAVGVIPKSASFDEVVTGVERVVTFGTLLTPEQRAEHLRELRSHNAEEHRRLAPFETLTRREAAVLGQLMAGRSVTEIAHDSVVAVTTVRAQVRAILFKLDVGSQLAATARANAAGWRPPS